MTAPVLLCIDANAGTLRRYQPKRDGSRGFLCDKFTVDPASIPVLGNPAHCEFLEKFRVGKRAKNKNVPSSGAKA